MDSDTEAVLACLERLCAIVMALSAYGSSAPEPVRAWADRELGSAQEIRERLRPQTMIGLGASWWAKKDKE